jgi:hypothetical protein
MSMYRNLSIVLLLVLLGVVVTRSNGLPPSESAAPSIVAKVVVENQTAAIPTTTVYTPRVGGLFRISTYMTVPVAVNSTNAGNWYMNVGWTDEAGVEQIDGFMLTFAGSTPPEAYGETTSSTAPGSVILVQSASGQPITYSVSGDSNADNGTYSLFFTVERLI